MTTATPQPSSTQSNHQAPFAPRVAQLVRNNPALTTANTNRCTYSPLSAPARSRACSYAESREADGAVAGLPQEVLLEQQLGRVGLWARIITQALRGARATPAAGGPVGRLAGRIAPSCDGGLVAQRPP